MRFLNNSKTLESNPLLKNLMAFLLLSLMLYLGLDVLLHQQQIGLTLDLATQTIMGDEENFVEPILFDTLLERVHFDILSSMITLMLIAVMVIRLQPKNQKQLSIHLSFLTAILSQIALILAFYYWSFIPVWIGLFLLWHLIALWMSANSVWRLYT